MKTTTFFFALAAMLFAFTSCDKVINPSGNVSQEFYNFDGFDAIDISDAFSAYVTFSPAEEGITVEADDNIHEYVDIKVLSDRLYVGLERNYNIQGPATLKVYIQTNADISGLYASGASTISIQDEFSATSARLEASGASHIIGEVDLDNLSANLSGASNFELTGTADDTEANLSGASTFGGYDLVMQDLDIDLSGASNGRLTVENSLSVDASGGSSMLYKGDPVITHQGLSGGSQLLNVE